MSRQTFPTFIIFQFFPLLSFYSNGFLTGQFPINHILPILNGVGYMLENLRSKNLIDHRTSIFAVHNSRLVRDQKMIMGLMDKNDFLPTQAISN
jgi:hypothetical protein